MDRFGPGVGGRGGGRLKRLPAVYRRGWGYHFANGSCGNGPVLQRLGRGGFSLPAVGDGPPPTQSTLLARYLSNGGFIPGQRYSWMIGINAARIPLPKEARGFDTTIPVYFRTIVIGPRQARYLGSTTNQRHPLEIPQTFSTTMTSRQPRRSKAHRRSLPCSCGRAQLGKDLE